MTKSNDQNLSKSVLTLTPVELGDTVQVRQALDEALRETLCNESLVGLYEDVTLENIKMLTMIVACIFAMTAQFAPIEFPKSRVLLGVCCGAYFVCSGFLQFVVTFIEQDLMYTSAPFKKGEKEWVLKAHSKLGRFDSNYKVTLELVDPATSETKHTTAKTWCIGRFFTKEGYLDEEGAAEKFENFAKSFLELSKKKEN
ncbi:hypothetical protein TrCOL_g10593 [Triparma columacea]|uniref:Signal peptidase complex subunit 2 n=1 Tax=Triparma columacea TaxID=722753 RepID=A0A9W7LA13_9STRA|nr:hypothetical protein TrCOL_g10593 [Triparma columacea]